MFGAAPDRPGRPFLRRAGLGGLRLTRRLKRGRSVLSDSARRHVASVLPLPQVARRHRRAPHSRTWRRRSEPRAVSGNQSSAPHPFGGSARPAWCVLIAGYRLSCARPELRQRYRLEYRWGLDNSSLPFEYFIYQYSSAEIRRKDGRNELVPAEVGGR